MRILLLNAGSSSLKCSLMESTDRTVIARATADWSSSITRYERSGPGEQRVSEAVPLRSHGDAVRYALDDLVTKAPAGAGRPAAVGHRIVHGGELNTPVRITPAVRSQIAALGDLAPLHNPPGLDTLAAAEAVLPRVPHVAVFDTSFHSTLPAAAYTYPLPHSWSTDWRIRRYGFHGLSHAYAAGRTAELLGWPAKQLRLITCHLGAGCSAAAILNGRSIDTTMGFTPLDGLMMATRSGSVDPGILTHVQLHHSLSAREVESALNHRSGLLGISGVSADMREVLAARRANNERAQLAVDVYVHRVRQAIGALAVTLGGVDALVFTAGVGENSPDIRMLVCQRLECLGLEIDTDANARCKPDADIARQESHARIFVIAAREDLAMLSEVVATIAT